MGRSLNKLPNRATDPEPHLQWGLRIPIEYLGFIVSPLWRNNGSGENPRRSRLASPSHRQGSPVVPRIRQLLPTLHRRLLWNRRTLTRLTRKDTPFIWNNTCQSVFETLKEAFTTTPVLAHYDPILPCVLETNSSDYALGAVLSQVHEPDSVLRPVTFHSRTLSSAEQNYEIYDKELNTIIDSFKHWRQYLEGTPHKTLVLTDHKGLVWFRRKQVLTRQQARWSEFLSEYDFDIDYREGRLMEKPDAFTRRSRGGRCVR